MFNLMIGILVAGAIFAFLALFAQYRARKRVDELMNS